MATLNVTHHDDRIVFNFTVGLDEIDLSQFGPGQQVSATTPAAPAEQPAEETPATPADTGEPPA